MEDNRDRGTVDAREQVNRTVSTGPGRVVLTVVAAAGAVYVLVTFVVSVVNR